MASNILARHGERRRGDIRRFDLCARKGARSENRQAPGAGAQIEDTSGAAAREQRLVQELGDVRARHDDTLVDVERLSAKPRFLEQVRDGHTLADPTSRKALDALDVLALYFRR